MNFDRLDIGTLEGWVVRGFKQPRNREPNRDLAGNGLPRTLQAFLGVWLYERLRHIWREARAPRRPALPGGTYCARIVGRAFDVSENGARCVRVTFEVAEGPLSGNRVTLTIWLTERAIGYAKRDLQAIGISDLAEYDDWVVPDNKFSIHVFYENQLVKIDEIEALR